MTSSAHKCCTSCSADKLTNYNVDKTDARQSREEVLRNNIIENPSELIWHGITTRAVHMCSACVPNVNKSVYKTILTQSTQYTQYRPAQTWSIQQLQCVCLTTYMYQWVTCLACCCDQLVHAYTVQTHTVLVNSIATMSIYTTCNNKSSERDQWYNFIHWIPWQRYNIVYW